MEIVIRAVLRRRNILAGGGTILSADFHGGSGEGYGVLTSRGRTGMVCRASTGTGTRAETEQMP